MKKSIIFTLTIVLVSSFIFSTIYAFGSDALDQGALNLFMSKLSSASEETRKDGANLLRGVALKGEEGIEELKLYATIGVLVEPEYQKLLTDNNYTINDLTNQLDRLKSWRTEDKLALANAVEAGDTSSIHQLISSNESSSNNTTNPIPGAGPTQPAKPEENSGKDSEKDVIKERDTNNAEEKLKDVKFADIDNHWAKDSIVFLAQRGIIGGKSENTFAPKDNVTRAEFAALLVRTFGLSLKGEYSEDTFKDVIKGKWYYEAVIIAYSNDIIKGKGNGVFDPHGNITREEMAVMSIKAMELKNLSPNMSSLMIDSQLSIFRDKNQISAWAIESCGKASKLGIINGQGNNTFAPKANATRAEAATILKSIYNILYK